MTIAAKRIVGTDTLAINSKVSFTRNGKTMDMLNDQNWYLTDKGKTLIIEQISNTNGDVIKIKMIFDKAVQ